MYLFTWVTYKLMWEELNLVRILPTTKDFGNFCVGLRTKGHF